MRADMSKVIVERPRHDHSDRYPRGALAPATRDFDSAPLREAMGRGYGTKRLNENLQPLGRYIARQVGRPWRLVHAEISERLSMRSAVQKHVLDHLREMVFEHVWWQRGVLVHASRYRGVRPLESWGSWRVFYVCPKSGLLRNAPQRLAVVPAQDPARRVLDANRELHLLNDVWFEVEIADIPRDDAARLECFDMIEHRVPEWPPHWDWRNQLRGEPRPPAPPVLWKAGRYAVSKRQLSKRELRDRGLTARIT